MLLADSSGEIFFHFISLNNIRKVGAKEMNTYSRKGSLDMALFPLNFSITFLREHSNPFYIYVVPLSIHPSTPVLMI